MKIIKKLSEMISEEIEDAEKYARCALMHKEDMPELAETFFRLSNEEMGHMNMLHDQVTRIITDYKKKNGEPPEGMMTLYNYLHEKQIDHAAVVKSMLGMFRS